MGAVSVRFAQVDHWEPRPCHPLRPQPKGRHADGFSLESYLPQSTHRYTFVTRRKELLESLSYPKLPPNSSGTKLPAQRSSPTYARNKVQALKLLLTWLLTLARTPALESTQLQGPSVFQRHPGDCSNESPAVTNTGCTGLCH